MPKTIEEMRAEESRLMDKVRRGTAIVLDDGHPSYQVDREKNVSKYLLWIRELGAVMAGINQVEGGCRTWWREGVRVGPGWALAAIGGDEMIIIKSGDGRPIGAPMSLPLVRIDELAAMAEMDSAEVRALMNIKCVFPEARIEITDGHKELVPRVVIERGAL